MAFDYYKAPAQDVFDSIKNAAIALWQTYDDTYGYASGKVNRVKSIENVGDNTGYIVAMFDNSNRLRLYGMVDEIGKPYLAELLKFSGDLPF